MLLGVGCKSELRWKKRNDWREKQKKERFRDKISLAFRNGPFAYWKTLRDIRRNFPRSTELKREEKLPQRKQKTVISSKVFRVGISLFQQYRQNLKEPKCEALRWIPLDLPNGWFASERNLWDVWWTVPRNTEAECGKLCDSDAYKEVAASNSWSEERRVQEEERQDAVLTF